MNIGQQRVHRSTITESADDIWRRLAPEWCAGYGQCISPSNGWSWNNSAWSHWTWDERTPYGSHQAPASSGHRSTPPTNSNRRAPYHRNADHYTSRSDGTTVRNLRRGTTADALEALRSSGVAALVDALIDDRYSRTGSSSILSLLKTWVLLPRRGLSRL